MHLSNVWQIKDIFKTSYSKCHGMEEMINFFHYNFSKNKCSIMKKKYPGNMYANDTWYFKTKKKFFETNISFQATFKKLLWNGGGNTLVLFSPFYQN